MLVIVIFLFAVIITAGQISQWLLVSLNLYHREYLTKKDFLIEMIPGYFIVKSIKILWNLFENFIMLD